MVIAQSASGGNVVTPTSFDGFRHQKGRKRGWRKGCLVSYRKQHKIRQVGKCRIASGADMLTETLDVQVPPDVAMQWGWFLALGIGLLALGVVSVVRSFQATMVSMVFFGGILLLACLLEVAQAVMVGHWAALFQHLVAAVLFGVTGFLLVTRPVIGAEVATLFMAMFFLIGGLFQLVGSVAIHLPGWGWQALDGLITIVLGVLVLSQWPASGLWVIGLFVGLDLMFYGLAWIAVAIGLRAA